jgi:hypothetical protein
MSMSSAHENQRQMSSMSRPPSSMRPSPPTVDPEPAPDVVDVQTAVTDEAVAADPPLAHATDVLSDVDVVRVQEPAARVVDEQTALDAPSATVPLTEDVDLTEPAHDVSERAPVVASEERVRKAAAGDGDLAGADDGETGTELADAVAAVLEVGPEDDVVPVVATVEPEPVAEEAGGEAPALHDEPAPVPAEAAIPTAQVVVVDPTPDVTAAEALPEIAAEPVIETAVNVPAPAQTTEVIAPEAPAASSQVPDLGGPTVETAPRMPDPPNLVESTPPEVSVTEATTSPMRAAATVLPDVEAGPRRGLMGRLRRQRTSAGEPSAEAGVARRGNGRQHRRDETANAEHSRLMELRTRLTQEDTPLPPPRDLETPPAAPALADRAEVCAELRFTAGAHAGETLSLDGRSLSIGSSYDADVRLPDETGAVASDHARIWQLGQRFLFRHVDGHGTVIGGEPVMTPLVWLDDGDEIEIGVHRMRFSLRSREGSSRELEGGDA